MHLRSSRGSIRYEGSEDSFGGVVLLKFAYQIEYFNPGTEAGQAQITPMFAASYGE